MANCNQDGINNLAEKYFVTALNDNPETFIKRPMHPDCKVAVVISAYREETETLLDLLESFLIQEGVGKNQFEIDIVVANKKWEALDHNNAFRANQKALALLNFISGDRDNLPKICSAEMHRALKIKASGLAVNAIDKSSETNSNVMDFSSVGRNRAGAEACFRFLKTGQGFDGVIATLDCDCTVSPNYIQEIIKTYMAVKGLNGLVGEWRFDFTHLRAPHLRYFKKAYVNYFLGSYFIKPQKEKFFKSFEEKKRVLQFASNMSVTVRAWILAGGIPKTVGSEDIIFGRKVESLPGLVGINHAYYIVMSVRFSDRTGARGDGKIISLLIQSIADFFSGHSNKIWYIDSSLIRNFSRQTLAAWKQGKLDGVLIKEIMEANRLDTRKFSQEMFAEYAMELGKHFGLRLGENGSPRYAWFIDEIIFDAYPKKDITSEILGPSTYKIYGFLYRFSATKAIYKFFYRIWRKIIKQDIIKSLQQPSDVTSDNKATGFLEKRTFGQAMPGACRLVLAVPAYDEDAQTLLRLFLSAAEQKGAGKESFAVIVNVNNSRREAGEKSAAFLQNQRLLKLLRFLAAQSEPLPDNLSKSEIATAEKIKKSGLKVIVLDNSSLDKAAELNNVGVARNAAAVWAAEEFLKSKAGQQGIIAMTDCECILSPNYVREITATFKKFPRLNGLSGQLMISAPPEMPYAPLVVEAVRLHLEKENKKFKETLEEAPDKIKQTKKIFFQKADNLPDLGLTSGQNMAVTAKAFLQAGGIPPLYSSEDRVFGSRVEKLEGDVAKNYGYWVEAELRPSQRAGWGSLGRRVSVIAKAVEDFMQGKSERILVPDLEGSKKFHEAVNRLYFSGKLTGKEMLRLTQEYGFTPHNLSGEFLQQWVEIFHQDNKLLGNRRNFFSSEQWLIEHLYEHYPKKDITKDLAEWAENLGSGGVADCGVAD